eukprot:PhF_6_TR32340/c0_g1_i1/m.47939
MKWTKSVVIALGFMLFFVGGFTILGHSDIQDGITSQSGSHRPFGKDSKVIITKARDGFSILSVKKFFSFNKSETTSVEYHPHYLRPRPTEDVYRYDPDNTFTFGPPDVSLDSSPTPHTATEIDPTLQSVLMNRRSGASSFHDNPSLTRFTNVCVDGTTVLLHTRPLEHAVRNIEHEDHDQWSLLQKKSIGQFPSRGVYHNGTVLLLRTPHHRNIAHAFHDALFVALHYLRMHYKKGSPLLIAHTDDWLKSIPESGLPERWADGLIASAMIDLGISRHALVPLKKGDYHCFDQVVYVGSSREGCGSASNCKGEERAKTFRWINTLRRYSFPGGVVPNRPKPQLSLYSRQDAPNRRLANDTAAAHCILRALQNYTTTTTLPSYSTFQIMVINRMPKVFWKQVQMWTVTDVMVAMVGASNTNSLWMNEESAVVELSSCSMGYLSWMFRVVRPKQAKIKFRLCNKKKMGVSGIGKVGDLGRFYSVPCDALLKLRVHRFNITDAIDYFLQNSILPSAVNTTSTQS